MNTIKLNVLGAAKAAAPGAEIKNQDKSVDITENGVTEVTADSGYTGLGKVTINANVQGGGASGESSIEYFRAADITDSYTLFVLTNYANRVNFYSKDNETQLACPYNPSIAQTMSALKHDLLAFGIDFKSRIITKIKGQVVAEGTAEDAILQQGLTKEALDALPRITEEEFYNLGA